MFGGGVKTLPPPLALQAEAEQAREFPPAPREPELARHKLSISRDGPGLRFAVQPGDYFSLLKYSTLVVAPGLISSGPCPTISQPSAPSLATAFAIEAPMPSVAED